MSVAIRLSRGGSKKRPYYKIVVANSRAPRDGKYLEQIGTYNPLLAKDDDKRITLIEDRARYWVGVGAQPTDRVARFLDLKGIKERTASNNPQKGEPGQKAKDRAEDRAAKLAEAEEAKAAAAAAPAPEPEAEPVVEEAAAEEAPAAEEATNEGVSAEAAPAEGAVEPAAEEPQVESSSDPVEGAAEATEEKPAEA